jgi:hypothetical protein
MSFSSAEVDPDNIHGELGKQENRFKAAIAKMIMAQPP